MFVYVCVFACTCVMMTHLYSIYKYIYRLYSVGGTIKIAHTGLNPKLGSECQLQWMKSNYINHLPVDGPSSFLSCTETHLPPYIIAFDLCNRQQHAAPTPPSERGDTSCH